MCVDRGGNAVLAAIASGQMLLAWWLVPGVTNIVYRTTERFFEIMYWHVSGSLWSQSPQ